MYEMNVPPKMRWILESRHTYKIFVDFDLPQDYEDQIGIGSPQIWMWVSAFPRGSSRHLLLITASFTGPDTEIDGAGKIGLALKENKDPLAFDARNKDWEEALVLSDSANFFLAWPEDMSEGLSPLLLACLNHINDCCCAVEWNFLEFLKFHNLVVTRTASFQWHSVFHVAFIPYKPL